MSEDVHVPPTTTEHFQAFLEAADRVALILRREKGIDPLAHIECEDYHADRLGDLMQAFCPPYQTTDIDDVMNFKEVEARVTAVHMVGLALGMRLAGRLGGAR